MRACDIAPAAEGATDRLAAIDPFSGLGTESCLSEPTQRVPTAAYKIRLESARKKCSEQQALRGTRQAM
jgi:hypothetical protein